MTTKGVRQEGAGSSKASWSTAEKPSSPISRALLGRPHTPHPPCCESCGWQPALCAEGHGPVCTQSLRTQTRFHSLAP